MLSLFVDDFILLMIKAMVKTCRLSKPMASSAGILLEVGGLCKSQHFGNCLHCSFGPPARNLRILCFLIGESALEPPGHRNGKAWKTKEPIFFPSPEEKTYT